MFPLVLGTCIRCGGKNKYSAHRLEQYRLRGWILTTLYKCCALTQREGKKLAAALERPDVEATATAVKDAGTMTEADPTA